MQELELTQTKENVINTFSRLFSCNLSEAEQTINSSSFFVKLCEDSEFAMNHDCEYWAREIKNETDIMLELKKMAFNRASKVIKCIK